MEHNIIRKKYLLSYLVLGLAPILYVLLIISDLPQTVVIYGSLENIPNQEVSKYTYYYVAGLGSIFAFAAMAVPHIGTHYNRTKKEIRSLMRFEVVVAIIIDMVCIGIIHSSAKNYIGIESESYLILIFIIMIIPLISINVYSKINGLAKKELAE